MFYITVSNGLLCDTHYEKMGAAVWQFMWCIDKITKIDEKGWGWVLGGKPIKLSEIPFGSRITHSRNLNELERQGYLQLIHAPYGVIIKVRNAKKRFNKIGKPVFKNGKPRNNNGKPNKTVSDDKSNKTKHSATRKDMSWKQYNENKHQDDVPSMNLDGEWEKEVPGATNSTHALITLFKLVNPTIETKRYWKSTHADCRVLFEVHDENWWSVFMPKYANFIKTDPFSVKATTPREMVNKLGSIEAQIQSKITQQKAPITSKGRGLA